MLLQADIPNAVDWTTILLALISALVSIATATLAYLANRSANQAKTQSIANAVMAQETQTIAKDTAKAVDGVVSKLLEAKDETIAATAAGAHAEGKAEGQQMTVTAPLPATVVIANPEPIEVTETPNK